uniref:kunitz-type protease inhibitor 2 n=1 Tax=Pristiophorus japonicus TaxID=55135 RepID=UPI00398E5ACD
MALACCCDLLPALLALMLLDPASCGSRDPLDDCPASYNTSSDTSLHPDSFQSGAELLGATLVNSSQLCRSQCCAVSRCNLALLQPIFPGKMNCFLVGCLASQKSACIFVPRLGYETNARAVRLPKSVDPTAIPPVNCLGPEKTGPCRASIPRWYYAVSSKTCKEFIYGGCFANGNNFQSEAECWKNCNGVTAPSNNSVPVSGRSVMGVKGCSGQCSAEEFTCDDGCCVPLDLMCDGTAQCRDKSDVQYCSAVCASYARLTEYEPPTATDNERCNAPKKVGNCRAAFPRWYFDPKTQICNMFIYGGCRGNKNNYESEGECIAACAGQKAVTPEPRKVQPDNADDEAYCFAPALTGKCRASFRRWHYDADTRLCKVFTYGGCSGNKNNYDSEDECLSRCSGRKGNEKEDDNGTYDEQHHPELRHHASAISMVVLLAICVLILLAGVIYFIIKLAKTDHVVSYHRTQSREDKETLINTVENL